MIEKILDEPYVILPETWAWDISPKNQIQAGPHTEKNYFHALSQMVCQKVCRAGFP